MINVYDWIQNVFASLWASSPYEAFDDSILSWMTMPMAEGWLIAT